MMSNTSTVQALKLMLHGVFIGVLTHHSSNRNVLFFNPEYVTAVKGRPTFTLLQRMNEQYLQKPIISSQKVAPVISNLLPEGAMREWVAKSLKVDINNDFALLAHFGMSLPGALMLERLAPGEIPDWVEEKNSGRIIAVKTSTADEVSLAGVQIKFSGNKNKDGRYNLLPSNDNTLIIKTPSTVYRNVPENEYSSMKLAQAIGVIIPEINLVNLDALDNLPDIQLPNEQYAYTIKRFDRVEGLGDVSRIHMEDFAQIAELYPHEKYEGVNYEIIGGVIYRYSAQPLADIQQMARRLLANILLGNGDAHLKNWSMIYPDKIGAVLSPAYDIVSTMAYMHGECEVAFSMGREKNWYKLNMTHFELWTKRIDVRWPAIKAHLQDAMVMARTTWPALLESLPMADNHKQKLKEHWGNLQEDFKINSEVVR